jgi:hypothetical protein
LHHIIIMLTPEEIELYRRQGFLVVPNFSSPTEVETLRLAGLDLVAKFDPSSVLSVFSTRNQKAYSSNQYFLDSANGIGYFLEEGALNAHGELTKPKEVALNKIGHGESRTLFLDSRQTYKKTSQYWYPKIDHDISCIRLQAYEAAAHSHRSPTKSI